MVPLAQPPRRPALPSSNPDLCLEPSVWLVPSQHSGLCSDTSAGGPYPPTGLSVLVFICLIEVKLT